MKAWLVDSLSENLPTKAVSVAIAVVLWFVVLGSRNIEAVKEIPIEIVSPAELVPANEIPEKIAFRLSGPKAFLRAIVERRDDPIRVNLMGSKAGMVTYRFYADQIRLPIGVKVMSVNPQSLVLKLEPVRRKDVPVKLEVRGLPEEGYRVVRTEIKPPMARIKGPESRVDLVREISTLPVDVSSLQDSVERDATLDLTRAGVSLDGPAPQIRIQIEPTSANFRIKNVDIRVLSPYKFDLDEKTVTVFVRANPKDLRSVDRSQVFATLDLRGKAKGKYREQVKVTLPERMGLVRVVPEYVTVTLE